MSIYNALHLSRVNAVYSVYRESMLWTPYLANAVDTSSPLSMLRTSDEEEGEKWMKSIDASSLV